MRRTMPRSFDPESAAAAARAGDSQAFERLVRAFAGPVYGHSLRFFGDPQSAEDASQEVFLRVYRSLPGFDGRSSFSTWLFTVTRSVCVDMFRKGRRAPLPIDPLSVPVALSPDHSGEVSMSVAIEAAICRLQPEDRDALSAVALFGLSYAEAAKALSVPAGTVKSRVFRARRTLSRLLDEVEGGAA